MASRSRLRKIPHDVYRIYDKEGILLYVGCSVNAFQRVPQHKYERQHWWPQAATVDINGYPNFVTARLVEAVAIATEAPLGNVATEANAIRRGRDILPVAIDSFYGVPIEEFWEVK